MSAARALIAAEGQNQTDEHLEIKIAQPQANVDVNVNVNGEGNDEGGIEVLMVPAHQLVSIPTLAEALAVLDEMGFVQLTDSGVEMMDIQRRALDSSGSESERDPNADGKA